MIKNEKETKGFKVKQRKWSMNDDGSIRERDVERDSDGRATEETTWSHQRFLQREPKSSNREKPEEEMEMGRRKRKKKGQGLVKKKKKLVLWYLNLKAIPTLVFFQSLPFIFHFYSTRTPAEFEKFHSRRRAVGMLTEPWQMEKMRRDQGRSGEISQVENVCVCALYVGENENYAKMKSDGLIISKRTVCVCVCGSCTFLALLRYVQADFLKFTSLFVKSCLSSCK